MTFFKTIFLASLFLLGSLASTCSHELWLDSKKFQVGPKENIEIELRNGEKFEGLNLSFFKNRIKQFFWAQNGVEVNIQSRAGDVPAAKFTAKNNGLLVVVYESTPSTIEYNDWTKFVSFVKHKDLGDVLSRHAVKGWPKKGFREIYHRYSKALIGVGDANGQDRRFGLELEFIALLNPYTVNETEIFNVKLLYQGRPRADAQIEIFERDPNSNVSVHFLRTDANGIVNVPVKPGFDYLLDSVILREYKTDKKDAPLWESLWAALTFSMPLK